MGKARAVPLFIISSGYRTSQSTLCWMIHLAVQINLTASIIVRAVIALFKQKPLLFLVYWKTISMFFFLFLFCHLRQCSIIYIKDYRLKFRRQRSFPYIFYTSEHAKCLRNVQSKSNSPVKAKYWDFLSIRIKITPAKQGLNDILVPLFCLWSSEEHRWWLHTWFKASQRLLWYVFVDFSSAFNTAQLHILMQWMLCSSCHTMKEVFNYFS